MLRRMQSTFIFRLKKILDENENLEFETNCVTSVGLKFSSAQAGGKKLGSPPNSLNENSVSGYGPVSLSGTEKKQKKE